jgi:hypothetical protein
MCIYLVTAERGILSKICNNEKRKGKKKDDFKEVTCVMSLRNAKRNANSFRGNGRETTRICAMLLPFMYVSFYKNIPYLTLQLSACFNSERTLHFACVHVFRMIYGVSE